MATQQSIRNRIIEIDDALASKDLHPLDRIKYLCEKGIMMKNTCDMARALREVSEIVETL
jgi:hypothetical protein